MNRLDPARVPLDRATLIEASAGTGKTYTIATLFVRLLLEQALLVSQILVVTYTRAATSELRDRIRRRVIEALAALDHGTADANLAALLAPRAALREADRAALTQALRDFDEAAIFTIHGFCQHALREWAFESSAPFELDLAEDQGPLLREVALDYFASVAYAADPELVAALLAGRGKPDDLALLAAKGVRDPDMAVLPEAVATPTPSPEPFLAARARAAKLWAEDRTAILHALSHAGLHRGWYPEAEMRTTWAEALDQLDSLGPLEMPDFLPKLRQSKLDEVSKKWAAPRHTFFVAVEKLCEAAGQVKAALDQQVLALRLGLVRYAREETARRRSERAAHSFDDLLHALHGALAGAGGAALARQIAARHKAALIDEFQDTDPVQYGIFQRIYGANGAPLFLIGDPKQAIYGFRGADVFAYLSAARACAAAVYTLDVNYRSDPGLLRALAALFGRARRPFLLDDIRFEPVRPEPRARERLRPAGPALEFLFVPRDARTQEKKISKGWADGNGQGRAQLPELVAYEVVRLLQSGATIDRGSDPERPELTPLKPRHIAVLCRTNAQARAVQRALAELSVPTVLEGDSSVFDQETAEELARVLWAIAEPSDRRKLNAALSTAILGVPGELLHRMQSDEAELEPWLERIARWSQLWHERGFVQMVHRVLHEAAVQPRLLARSDGERRLTDLWHLCELLHRASVEQHLGPLSLLHWYAEMRNDPEARARTGLVADAEQMRLEHDEHAVKLTTVHRSKGLEHEVVFCPYLWCGPVGDDKDVRFHDHEDGDRVKLDLGSPEHARHKALAEREDLAERLRLLYVALTRAKHRCYVVWGRFNGSEASALGYLLHQGEGAKLEEPVAIEQRIGKMTDRELLAELEALRAAADGSIAVREIGFERPEPYAMAEPVPGDLHARERTRQLAALPRMTSFSRLLADAATAPGGQAPSEESRDHDAHQSLPLMAALDQAQRGPQVVLHAFPAGSRPGSLIHSVLEHIDFRRADPAELGAEVDRQLGLYGVDAAQHRDALVLGLERVLQTPLSQESPPLRLGDIARADRIDELEFTLGARSGAETADLGRIADLFARHRAPACTPDYAERLRALGPTPGAPFLKGFIDLVFRAQGRFYIVDYKSNWLGARAGDYAQPQLVAAMDEHHYFLQYHLYTLALHRYLQLRMPGYDYARDFGGVYYLFVRGMGPDHAPGTGVFFDRPERALIDALAAALGAAEAA